MPRRVRVEGSGAGVVSPSPPPLGPTAPPSESPVVSGECCQPPECPVFLRDDPAPAFRRRIRNCLQTLRLRHPGNVVGTPPNLQVLRENHATPRRPAPAAPALAGGFWRLRQEVPKGNGQYFCRRHD